MSAKGAELVIKTVNLIEANQVEIQEQNDSEATPAPKITKELCRIEWNQPAEKIHNLVRGLSPFPGSYFDHGGKSYKIFETQLTSHPNLNPSEIMETKTQIFIGTSDKTLQILEIQPEGRKRMSAVDFLKGYSLSK